MFSTDFTFDDFTSDFKVADKFPPSREKSLKLSLESGRSLTIVFEYEEENWSKLEPDWPFRSVWYKLCCYKT